MAISVLSLCLNTCNTPLSLHIRHSFRIKPNYFYRIDQKVHNKSPLVYNIRFIKLFFQESHQMAFCKIRCPPGMSKNYLQTLIFKVTCQTACFRKRVQKAFIKIMNPPGILRKILQKPCSSDRLLQPSTIRTV